MNATYTDIRQMNATEEKLLAEIKKNPNQTAYDLGEKFGHFSTLYAAICYLTLCGFVIQADGGELTARML